MKTTIRAMAVAALLLLSSAACTPEEVAFWAEWHALDPQTSALAFNLTVDTEPAESVALPEDVGAEQVTTDPPDDPPHVSEWAADNVRCFILAGGTFCAEEGTQAYEDAERLEAEYLATVG